MGWKQMMQRDTDSKHPTKSTREIASENENWYPGMSQSPDSQTEMLWQDSKLVCTCQLFLKPVWTGNRQRNPHNQIRETAWWLLKKVEVMARGDANHNTILSIIWKRKLFKIISVFFVVFFLQWPSLKGSQTSKQALISYSILARFHNVL